ncbi:hypothetical protein DPMN_011365 [Dreissena polymorpha]|uniref:Uncharacterized protein n=1 Tax=Dreissena polymorpha TaxID=45954 RepID=A0A9D4N4Y0_DREPO|nr:hypothetical protein DPMN_011365 [Dreissena polymorpha]
MYSNGTYGWCLRLFSCSVSCLCYFRDPPASARSFPSKTSMTGSAYKTPLPRSSENR